MSRVGSHHVLLAIAILFNLSVAPLLHADDKEDFDTYKIRIDGRQRPCFSTASMTQKPVKP